MVLTAAQFQPTLMLDTVSTKQVASNLAFNLINESEINN